PYIHGNAQAWPNSFAARTRALRTLKSKFPGIVDAIEVGGSGDMYAGLNEEERGILKEVTGLGLPPRTWTFYETMGVGALEVMFQGIETLDPSYFDDFWKRPGYLGYDPPPSLRDARIQHRAKVTRVIMSNEAGAAGVPIPTGPGRRPDPDPDRAWRTFEADFG